MKDPQGRVPELYRALKLISERIPGDPAEPIRFSESFLIAYIALEHDLRNCVQIGLRRPRAFLSKGYVAKLLGGIVYGIDVSPAPEIGELAQELDLVAHMRVVAPDSRTAAAYFRETGTSIDMLQLDGSHSPEAIAADVEALVPLLRDGGWIVLDRVEDALLRALYLDLQQAYPIAFDNGHCVVFQKVGRDAAISAAERSALDTLQALATIAEESVPLSSGRILQALGKEAQPREPTDEMKSLADQLQRKELEIQALNEALAGVYSSRSWRLTRPLRDLKPLLVNTRGRMQMALYGLRRRIQPFSPRSSTRGNKVSVVITAYNHEKYIAQCLDSVLMQKGFFNLEIIVGDDCSLDGTLSIIERYAERHPGRIRIMPRTHNLGVTRNLQRCLEACTGEYIAVCEGDDYWTDKHKLQKQLEFLEDHPDFSMCFSSFLFQFGDETELVPFESQTRLSKTVLSTADLIEENYIGNFSCCMYPARIVRSLPAGIYDVFTVDWMFNMACGELGPIGFLREPMSVYRKHGTGAWAGKPTLEQVRDRLGLLGPYRRLLRGKYDAEFAKLRASLFDALNQHSRAQQGTESGVLDLLILDTVFPHPFSPFRMQEFNSYLDHFPSSLVLTTGEHLPAFKEDRDVWEVIQAFQREQPDYAARTMPVNHDLSGYTARLAYATFLTNIYLFLDALEREAIPFVFTLYPGGGFTLNQPESDAKLTRVLSSPQFRKVIVTQKITYDYLIERRMCSARQIEFIYGVVTPLDVLAASVRKSHFGFGKENLDICFVAHKYMQRGIDKGYDVFVETARELASKCDNIRFHVVGNFTGADIPLRGLDDRLFFYGQRPQPWFNDFYRDKDMILSPNVPFVLLPGTFDGFPTAACTEASLRKVAMFCTDDLRLNIKFTDRKDIVIIPHDPAKIAEIIRHYYAHPAELKSIAENGCLRVRELYGYDNQIAPRIRLLERELQGTV